MYDGGSFRGAAFVDVGSVELATGVKDSLIAGDHPFGRIGVGYSAGLEKPYIKNEPTSSVYLALSGVVGRSEFEEYMSRFDGIIEIRFGASYRSGHTVHSRLIPPTDEVVQVSDTQRSRAFIDFTTVEQAKAAVDAVEGKLINFGGIAAHVERANFANPRKVGVIAPTDKLHIPDIPYAHAADELEPLLGEHEGFQRLLYGASLEVLPIPMLKLFTSRLAPAGNWAIAIFDSVDHATAALKAVRGYTWKHADRPIKIKYSTRRSAPKPWSKTTSLTA